MEEEEGGSQKPSLYTDLGRLAGYHKHGKVMVFPPISKSYNLTKSLRVPHGVFVEVSVAF